ncbi:MAG TPA: hypothetical protein VEZ90_03575, partial [Blastocatellia bacterium]|nr:hypothetical protein [Blastocatellia bacterium]
MNRVLVIAIILAVTTSTYTACARNPDDGSTNATSQKMGSRPNTQPSINVAQSGTPLITTPSQPGSNGAGQSQASPGSLGNGGAIIGSGGANEGSRLFSEMGCSAC